MRVVDDSRGFTRRERKVFKELPIGSIVSLKRDLLFNIGYKHFVVKYDKRYVLETNGSFIQLVRVKDLKFTKIAEIIPVECDNATLDERRRKLTKNLTCPYDLIDSNCEHVSRFVSQGSWKSYQTEKISPTARKIINYLFKNLFQKRNRRTSEKNLEVAKTKLYLLLLVEILIHVWA